MEMGGGKRDTDVEVAERERSRAAGSERGGDGGKR